jgi:hypothetical protein
VRRRSPRGAENVGEAAADYARRACQELEQAVQVAHLAIQDRAKGGESGGWAGGKGTCRLCAVAAACRAQARQPRQRFWLLTVGNKEVAAHAAPPHTTHPHITPTTQPAAYTCRPTTCLRVTHMQHFAHVERQVGVVQQRGDGGQALGCAATQAGRRAGCQAQPRRDGWRWRHTMGG